MRVLGKVILVAKPGDFVAKRIVFSAPGGIACDLTTRFRLFFLVVTNGRAVDRQMKGVDDPCLLALTDQLNE